MKNNEIETKKQAFIEKNIQANKELAFCGMAYSLVIRIMTTYLNMTNQPNIPTNTALYANLTIFRNLIPDQTIQRGIIWGLFGIFSTLFIYQIIQPLWLRFKYGFSLAGTHTPVYCMWLFSFMFFCFYKIANIDTQNLFIAMVYFLISFILLIIAFTEPKITTQTDTK